MAGASPRLTLSTSVPPSRVERRRLLVEHALPRARVVHHAVHAGEHQIALLDAGEAQVRVVGHVHDDRALGHVVAPAPAAGSSDTALAPIAVSGVE